KVVDHHEGRVLHHDAKGPTSDDFIDDIDTTSTGAPTTSLGHDIIAAEPSLRGLMACLVLVFPNEQRLL
ncbi:MAG: hypothetical protein MUO35_11400, partial [Anaerolineales bacterium]|nr:hypothetical protein [Anaerolineales bacterium]